MDRRDFKFITAIGAAAGLLVQPILTTLGPSITRGASSSFPVRVVVFFIFLFGAPTALWIASFLSKWWGALYQFAKFAAVGALNTLIDFGVLNLLISATGASQGIGYDVSKGISFLFATTNSFFWNKFWTFNAREGVNAKQTVKFYIIAVGGWILNVSAASIVVNVFTRPTGISPNLWANVGAVAGVAASFLWDFLGFRYIVFKKTE